MWRESGLSKHLSLYASWHVAPSSSTMNCVVSVVELLCQCSKGRTDKLMYKLCVFWMTAGVLINIECRVWAPNIEYNQEKGRGFVHFELMINWGPLLGKLHLQPVTKQCPHQSQRKLLDTADDLGLMKRSAAISVLAQDCSY